MLFESILLQVLNSERHWTPYMHSQKDKTKFYEPFLHLDLYTTNTQPCQKKKHGVEKQPAFCVLGEVNSIMFQAC